LARAAATKTIAGSAQSRLKFEVSVRGTDYRIVHVVRQALQSRVNDHGGAPFKATSLPVTLPVLWPCSLVSSPFLCSSHRLYSVLTALGRRPIGTDMYINSPLHRQGIRSYKISLRVFVRMFVPFSCSPFPFSFCLPSPWVDIILIAATLHTIPDHLQMGICCLCSCVARVLGSMFADELLNVF